MKFRGMWLPLVAALALPGAIRAQEEECPCRERPGMIGVMFDTDGDEDGVRVVEVRPGSPAARAGVRGGDIVIQLNGEDADEGMDALPRRLQAGDTVRLRVRRVGGAQEEIVVIAEPREAARFSFIRPEGGENIIIVNGDTMRVPIQELTGRIDSLHTRLMDLEGSRLRVEVDSLVRVFSDSAAMWVERMPRVEFRMGEPMELDEEMVIAGEMRLGEGRPFFLELGRRAAAGAELAEMNEGLSRYFGGQREGALVIDVAAETPAARAGLQAGDVIVRAGGEEVADPEDVRRALNRADAGQVELQVIRQGRRETLSLAWEGAEERFFQRERVRSREPVRAREPVRQRVRVQTREN